MLNFCCVTRPLHSRRPPFYLPSKRSQRKGLKIGMSFLASPFLPKLQLMILFQKIVWGGGGRVPAKLHLLSVYNLMDLVKENGPGCCLCKRDLKYNIHYISMVTLFSLPYPHAQHQYAKDDKFGRHRNLQGKTAMINWISEATLSENNSRTKKRS